MRSGSSTSTLVTDPNWISLLHRYGDLDWPCGRPGPTPIRASRQSGRASKATMPIDPQAGRSARPTPRFRVHWHCPAQGRGGKVVRGRVVEGFADTGPRGSDQRGSDLLGNHPAELRERGVGKSGAEGIWTPDPLACHPSHIGRQDPTAPRPNSTSHRVG
jgi:hypothetical protein